MGRRGVLGGLAAATATLTVLGVGVTVVPASADAAGPRIQDIHGSTFRSPYDGKQVANVTGVVTAVATAGSGRGFYFQDTGPAVAGRSAGMYVFTGSKTPAVAPGDRVLVTGTVQDYFPDAPDRSSVDLPVTEISKATWTTEQTGQPVPAPLTLDASDVPATLTADAGGATIEHNELQPGKYALDFYKAHESELVQLTDAPVIGPANSYGEMWVTARRSEVRTPRGGDLYTSYDQPNSGRLLVTALPGAAKLPAANVGDTLTGATVGPLSYSEFGGYAVLAERTGALRSGGIKPETTRAERSGELSVATYNVENLAPTDAPAKFARLADGVVHNLATPDILSLEEIQDNDGATDDGVTAADKTLTMFTDAVVAAGGPRYQWREIDPVNDRDGGQPGGNIRVAFLFDPAKVSFVDRPGGTSTTPVGVTGPFLRPRLTASPGRIDPASPAWQDSRKPLAGEFRFQNHTVFVVANHFDSKGGDQPLEGRYQPPARSSEIQRIAQASLVHQFVTGIESRDPAANVVVLGDLNDYQFSPALRTLTAGNALIDLINTLPVNERYSYVYQGNSQVLDHILVSGGLALRDYDVVHTNAEFADQVSDHDPQVLRVRPIFP